MKSAIDRVQRHPSEGYGDHRDRRKGARRPEFYEAELTRGALQRGRSMERRGRTAMT